MRTKQDLVIGPRPSTAHRCRWTSDSARERCCSHARPSGLAPVAAEGFRRDAQEAKMTAKPKTARKTTAGKPLPDRPLAAGHASKLDLVVSLLVRPDGASLAELDRRDRLAGALGPRRARGIAQEEGPRHPLREDRRRAPLPDRSCAMTAGADIVRDVEALERLDLEGLRALWRDRFGTRSRLRSPELLRLCWPGACRPKRLAGSTTRPVAACVAAGACRPKGWSSVSAPSCAGNGRGDGSRSWSRPTASAGRTGPIPASPRWRPPSPVRAGTARASSACGSPRR